ncbi:methyltransferase [Calidifontibacter sp. DB0510]|uniref:Methyltransferase n=1 Tax=Metallococcus carri TaxID=1656884 RepID=A0A967AZQ1_9MICO|nr:methyltransferase [Metallococcus carri]NHN56091.1 methyltransferase [Metallococcus carri]NOP37452.1 methyltransferase [Calidifontibacter sp. DB2511S]
MPRCASLPFGVVSDHYFTAEPASPDERREIEVSLAGSRYAVQVASGVFSPGHVDAGTQVLLKEAPQPPAAGTFLDLGCGWGPIALSLALQSPAATVYAVDVNERALDLTRRNAERLGCKGIRAALPDEVPADVTFDLIWSNPPIRVGKGALHELMQTWLTRLAPGGSAYLVVQKNLGADSLAKWIDATLDGVVTRRHAVGKGFRVLHVSRAE